MSDLTIIILALIALVVPILNWLTVRGATKAAERAAIASQQAVIASQQTASKLDVVHNQINGMKDELVRATGAEQRLVGEATGREKAIAERQERVVEAERVEDRKEDKVTKKLS